MAQLIPQPSLFIISMTSGILFTYFLHVCISAPAELSNKSMKSLFLTNAATKDINFGNSNVCDRKPSPPISVHFATANIKGASNKKDKTSAREPTNVPLKLTLVDVTRTICPPCYEPDHAKNCTESAECIEDQEASKMEKWLQKQSPNHG